MEKQRGRQPTGHQVAPVHHLVERVQLARVMEAGKNKRGQTENIKMAGLRSTAPPEVNKQANRHIRRADQILIGKRHAARHLADINRRRDVVNHGLAVHSLTSEIVNRLSPGANGSQGPGYVVGARDCLTLNGAQAVALADARPFSRAVGRHPRGNNAISAVRPDHPVVRQPELMVLLIVHPGRNRGSDGDDRQQSGRELKSQFLKHVGAMAVREHTTTLLFYVQFWCHQSTVTPNYGR